MSFELAACDQPLDATGKTKLIKCCEEINVNGVRSLLTQNANRFLIGVCTADWSPKGGWWMDEHPSCWFLNTRTGKR